MTWGDRKTMLLIAYTLLYDKSLQYQAAIAAYRHSGWYELLIIIANEAIKKNC